MNHPRVDVNQVDEHGYTILDQAILSDKTRIAKFLIRHPLSNLNYRDPDESAVLLQAVIMGNLKVFKALLRDSSVIATGRHKNGMNAFNARFLSVLFLIYETMSY